MKRQIYVPFLLLENGQIPKKAIIMSQETQLGIQIGEEVDLCDEVKVISIPEIHNLAYHSQVKSGFIQSIDYINEFCNFNRNTILEITTPVKRKENIKPRIRETHALIFRERLYEKGKYSFQITNLLNSGPSVLTNGFFEVV